MRAHPTSAERLSAVMNVTTFRRFYIWSKHIAEWTLRDFKDTLRTV